MPFDATKALALAEQLEQADREATKGEWTGELDCFTAEDGIVALVADRETSMLFTAGTEVPLHQQDGETWSTEDSAKRDAQWAKARQTQALKDARSIATLRNLAASCARALREACQQLEWEREHSKMLSDTNTRLCLEQQERDAFLAKVRGEYTQARASCEAMTKHVAHNDEEYATMKDVLRAERQECQRLRTANAALAAEVERWKAHANRLDQIEMDHAAEGLSLLQECERLRAEKDAAWANDVRLAAKFAALAPKDGEIDSVMSLLNWCRANHDADSAARVWLERVVKYAIDAERASVHNCQSPAILSDQSKAAIADIEAAAVRRLSEAPDSAVRASPDCEAPFCTHWNPCEPCEHHTPKAGKP